MSGNSLQMFSIMMVFMLFKAPIQALMNINQTFARFESDGKKQEMLMVKAAFIGCNLLALALGTWKVNQMGLLPWVLLRIRSFGCLTNILGSGLRDQTGLHGKWRENRWNGRTSSRHENGQTSIVDRRRTNGKKFQQTFTSRVWGSLCHLYEDQDVSKVPSLYHIKSVKSVLQSHAGAFRAKFKLVELATKRRVASIMSLLSSLSCRKLLGLRSNR
jgi:hypothetical protein